MGSWVVGWDMVAVVYGHAKLRTRTLHSEATIRPTVSPVGNKNVSPNLASLIKHWKVCGMDAYERMCADEYATKKKIGASQARVDVCIGASSSPK